MTRNGMAVLKNFGLGNAVTSHYTITPLFDICNIEFSIEGSANFSNWQKQGLKIL